MQVNMLEAKSQLSRLVKAALAGKEVIIASQGKAQVKLVPCTPGAGLQRPGALAGLSSALVDAAFSEAADQEVAYRMAVSADAHWCGYDVTLHRV